MQKDKIQNYRISVAHKTYHPGTVHVRVEGLQAGDYTLSNPSIEFNGIERENINLHVADKLSAGVYPLFVHAWSDDGWRDVFRVHHVVTRGN
jgi:hypothetical protein